jgi:predicted transcriptional regulator of viral defense system
VYKVVPLSAESGRAAIEDPLAVAMSLFAPCYISGWTAAEYWELTEQVSNSIMIRSAKPQRAAHQKLGGVNFIVRRVPESSIFGTTNVWSGTVAIVMATSHRTVIDLLDAPETGGGGRQALDIIRSYWQRPGNDPDLLLELATRLGRGSVFKRLGFTTERFAAPGSAWLDRCRKQLSAGIALLDPSGPVRGPIVSRWRLRINVPLDDQP